MPAARLRTAALINCCDEIALISQHATKDKTANVAPVSPRSKPPPVTARSLRALPNWPSSGSTQRPAELGFPPSWPSRSAARR